MSSEQWNETKALEYLGHLAEDNPDTVLISAEKKWGLKKLLQTLNEAVDRQTGMELRSLLSMPLRVKESTIGVIQAGAEMPDRFSAADLVLLEPLAATAAMAIENSRLYEQARRDAQTKSMLLQEVNHRVGNNLSAIMGLLNLAMKRPIQQAIDYQTVLGDMQNRVSIGNPPDRYGAPRFLPRGKRIARP